MSDAGYTPHQTRDQVITVNEAVSTGLSIKCEDVRGE